MEPGLLDKMLSSYREQKTVVTIVLQNRTRITGRISMFDSYVILMEDQKQGLIYRHAVSSLLPVTHAGLPASREQKSAQVRPAPKPSARIGKHPPQTPSQSKHSRSTEESRTAQPASGINTGMKEGLLRWMQEKQTGK